MDRTKKPEHNPHVETDLMHCLPPNSPAAEFEMLTQVQQFALPVLLWFFDTERYRAEGRTTVAVHVALMLAKRGNVVDLNDYSQATRVSISRNTRYFIDALYRIMKTHYSRDCFEVDEQRKTLRYRGRRPQ